MDINEFGLNQEYFGFGDCKCSENDKKYSNFSFEETDEYKNALSKHEANNKAIRDNFYPKIDALPNTPESEMQRNLLYSEMEAEFGREKNRLDKELKNLRLKLGLSGAQSGLQAIAGLFQNLGIRPTPASSVVQTRTDVPKAGGSTTSNLRKPLIIGGAIVGLSLVGFLIYKIAKK